LKHVDADLLRQMTDREIFGNLFDAMRAGTDTVSKNLFILFYFLKKNTMN